MSRAPVVAIQPKFSDASLRDALVQAINGWPIPPEVAWAILHRWDANNPSNPQPSERR